jgi:transglutaminase-like putative cysteine protease
VEKFHEIALLGMLAAGYFALAGSLDWPTAALTLAALSLRALIASGLVRLEFPPRLATVVAIACMGFFPLDLRYVSESFLTAVVHLVCFLAVIKILSARTPRDFAWVKVIATMELLAASLVSASPAFFAFLALFLLCAVAALSSGEIVRSTRALPAPEAARLAYRPVRAFPRRLAVLSCVLFGGILMMTAGMFFVLPRTARAALQRFVPSRYHLPGFSNEISLGEIGEIKQRSTPVMHVRPFANMQLPSLRWRGAALAHFDGKRWFNRPGSDLNVLVDNGVLVLPASRRLRAGQLIGYDVQLSEIASDTLFFAGNPESIYVNLPRLRRTSGGALRVPPFLVSGLRYRAYAFLEDESAPLQALPAPISDSQRQELLELPRTDRRIIRLAREMTVGAATQEDMARALERRLRQDYGYTLELPSTEVADPLANFLFERKKGHCEYFASAMAVMLRTMGIPSRVATGFLGGVYNPMTGWQVVRASDAHSWVEAWIDGRGWTTFDPTPPATGPPGAGVLSGLALLADAAGQFWQDWVLSYDIERQVVLASRIGESSRRIRFDWFEGIGAWIGVVAARIHWAWIAAAVAAGLVLIFSAPAIREWRRRVAGLRRIERGEAHASDATLLYSRMLNVLERRGIRKPPWVTPVEFVRMLPASEMAAWVDRMTAAYNECRFGGRREAAIHMVELLEQIESSPLSG